jgi:hypothetical protein
MQTFSTNGGPLRSALAALTAGALSLFCSCDDVPSSERPSSHTSHHVSALGSSINWKGHSWSITSGGMAGVASGDPSNVFVDANGYLHLRIRNNGGAWTAAEIISTDNMGFGTYQWQIDGQVDRLDKNVVLGLFPYGPAGGIGADGTNEIDVEYARWGNASWPNGNWTIYPSSGSTVGSHTFDFTLGSQYTTSTFVWSSTNIAYSLQEGFKAIGDGSGLIAAWTYAPSNSTTNIPQRAVPLGMNLWCFEAPPSNGQDVELVIRDFQFVPQGSQPTPYQYVITASAGAGGAITPAGPVKVNQGANQAFTITPNPGYAISSVSVDGTNKGTVASFVFSNVQAAHTISATFSESGGVTNIAPSGTGYTWSKNTSATSNGNRAAARGINDNNLTSSTNCNVAGENGKAMWEGAGVVWAATKSISSVKFVNGALDGYGNGFFEANCKLQFSTDGTTWTDSGWTISPGYPNSSAAAGKTFTFSGTARSGVQGARIVGQTGAMSWSWTVIEVQIFGQ